MAESRATRARASPFDDAPAQPDSGANLQGKPAATARSAARATGLACACLFVAMLNLTLVVAGLKELVVDDLGGSVADAALFFTVEMVAYLLFAPLWGTLSDRIGRRRPFIVGGFAASGLLYSPTCGSTRSRCCWRCAFCREELRSPAGRPRWRCCSMAPKRSRSRPRLAGLAGASLILGVGPWGARSAAW